MRPLHGHVFLALALTAGGLFGCQREDPIHTYQAPKDAPPLAAVPAPTESATPAEGPPIAWTLPAGWTALAGNSVRYATLSIPSGSAALELTVVPLPMTPQSASPLANLVRWQGQLGLPVSSEADLPKFVSHVDLPQGGADIIDLTSPDHRRLLGVLVPWQDRVWTFRLAGPEEAVTAQLADFQAFIASIRFPAADSAPAAPTTAPAGTVAWTAPPGWTVDPSHPMSVAAFAIGSGDDGAEVLVTRLAPGNAGSIVDNIRRWRGEVGLGPPSEGDSLLPRRQELGGRPWFFFDYAGPDPGAPRRRVRIALTPTAGDLWFVKILGSASAVEHQDAAFAAFLESLQIGESSGD